MPDEKDYRFTGHNSSYIDTARRLRKEMTPQERHLWYDFLRSYPIKIYRQRPIDQYIVDFYCSKARLVIEIDGSQHYTIDGMAYDQLRTEILEHFQLEILRFSNTDIDRNFRAVCEKIDLEIRKRVGKGAEV